MMIGGAGASIWIWLCLACCLLGTQATLHLGVPADPETLFIVFHVISLSMPVFWLLLTGEIGYPTFGDIYWP